MTQPELAREQWLTENAMHIKKCIAASVDPNLSRVHAEDLSKQELQLWGMYRDLLQFVKTHGNDPELSIETVAELKTRLRDFSLPTEVIMKEERTESRKNFIAFINNSLGTIQAATILIKDMPQEWASYYADFIRADIETYT